MEDRVSGAKIRASLRWLVFTAYQNNPPIEIRDPIYKDYNQEDKIKPQIVHKLSTAELYSKVLSVLYKDPNMLNLNSWGVIQVLGRKGVDVRGPSAVTETTLMQTSPIRIAQHCAVIDALMTLHLRETMMSNGVSTIKKKLKYTETPDDIEEFIVSWINNICQSLKVVLEDKKENKHKELPKFEKLNSLDDVKDGASILAVFSYFHPQTVPWTDIDFSRGNKSAAFNNFNTIKTAAKKTLPYDIMHIQFIDLFNSEVDMKRNILCFLLDMINRLEFGVSPSHQDEHQDEQDEVVVETPITPPPVASLTMPRETKYVFHEEPKPVMRYAAQAAGVPSQRTADAKTYAGRRASKYFSDDNQSQISIENIGGSVENISAIGRNPDKELRTHSGRRTSGNISSNVGGTGNNTVVSSAAAGYVSQKKNSNNNNQTFDIRSAVASTAVADNGETVIYHNNKQTIESLREKMFNTTNFLVQGADENIISEPPRENKRSVTEISVEPPQQITSPRHIYSRKTSLKDLNSLDSSFRDNMQGYTSLNSSLLVNTNNTRELSEPPSWSQPQQLNNHTNNNEDNSNSNTVNTAAINDHLDAVKKKLEMRRKRIESEKRKSYISPPHSSLPSSSLPSMDSMEPYSGSYLEHNHNQQQQQQYNQQQPEYSPRQQQQQQPNNRPQLSSGMSMNDLNEQISSLSKNLSLLATQQDQLQEIIKHNNEAVIKTVEPLYERRRTWGNPMPIDFGGSMQNLHSLQMHHYAGPPLAPPPLQNVGAPPQLMPEHEASPYTERLYNPYSPYQPPPPPAARVMQRTYSYDPMASVDPAPIAPEMSYYGAPTKKIHCPVDAPRLDDMAPQNISFIEHVNEDDDPLLSPLGASGNEKKLSIDSTTSLEQREQQKRLSLSSSFNDHKRNSLTNSTFKIEDENDGTSASIITKPLGDDKNGAKGFIIEFDDDDKDMNTKVKKKSKTEIRLEEPPPSKTPDPVMIMLDMNEDTDSSNVERMDNTEDDSNNFDSAAGDSIPHSSDPSPTGLHINNNSSMDKSEMDKKKEKIMLMSSKRKQMVERNKRRRMEEAKQKKEREAEEAEEKVLKKQENDRKREAILEAHKSKKEQKSEEDSYMPKQAKPIPKLSSDKMKKGSRQSSSGGGSGGGSNLRRSTSRGNFNSLIRNKSSQDNNDYKLNRLPSSVSLERLDSTNSNYSSADLYSSVNSPFSRSNYFSRANKNDPESMNGSRDSIVSRRTYTARHGSNSSLDDDEYYYNDYMTKYHGGVGGSSSTIGKDRERLSRQSSAKYERSPVRSDYYSRYDYDDCISEISSTSGWSTYDSKEKDKSYSYQPAPVKSNRSILMNAIEYVVFPGAVNKETRKTVLEEIDSWDCPHFLILFRDARFQFRGLYAYYPDTDEVFKIYGTGPKQISKDMFENFYKYNSSGKKFTQVHTKALTCTIDAFIIKNSLWLGKRGTSRVRKPSIGH